MDGNKRDGNQKNEAKEADLGQSPLRTGQDKQDKRESRDMQEEQSKPGTQATSRAQSGPSGLPVTFSTLVLSLGSSAVLAMGLEKNPHSDKYEKDLNMASFNIDMLKLLREKTKGNLTNEETQFLNSIVNDLQLKFVYVSQNKTEPAP